MLRAELRKLRTTTTTLWLWVIGIVVIAVGAYSTVSSDEPAAIAGHLRDQPFHDLTAVNLTLVALLMGVRSMTDEYRFDTVSWTLLTQHSRRRAFAAKAVVAASCGALIGITAQLVGLAVALLVIDSSGGKLEIDAGDVGAIVGLTAVTASWAMLGVAFGALIRNQVVAVALGLVWVLAVENLGSVVLGAVGRFFPGQAGYSLASVGEPDGLPPSIGLAVLLCYLALLLSIAAFDFERRPLFRDG